MTLFATPPDPRIARPTAPHRATLAQRLAGAVTGPDQRVRDLLEAWFARLPGPAQTDVRSRLWERDRRLALAAFWELYLHELLTRLGYRLVPHPTVPGAGARPDFLATRDQEAFYLEALIHGPPTEAWRAERRLYPILDVLHEVQREPFVVTLAQATCGHGTPPLRALRSELVRWLDSLSTATTDATLSWQRGSWSLQFRARRAGSERADEPVEPGTPAAPAAHVTEQSPGQGTPVPRLRPPPAPGPRHVPGLAGVDLPGAGAPTRRAAARPSRRHPPGSRTRPLDDRLHAAAGRLAR
jgi:hypothetical protein